MEICTDLPLKSQVFVILFCTGGLSFIIGVYLITLRSFQPCHDCAIPQILTDIGAHHIIKHLVAVFWRNDACTDLIVSRGL